MDRHEAKMILQACRPDGRDAALPVFAEALRLVEQDPELRNWWEQQQAFDRKMTAKLKEVPLPANLRATIMAAHKLEPAASRSRLLPWLAIAALFVMLLVVGEQMRPAAAGAAPLGTTQYLASVLPLLHDDRPNLGMMSPEHTKIMAWLKDHGSPTAFPFQLSTLKHLGCQTYAVHGHTVSLICFGMRNGGEAHLFIVDKAALADPPGTTPSYAQNGEWFTASWSDAGHSYVLATTDNPEALKQLL